MVKKKQPEPAESFKSIQIISAKAQSLWAKARSRMQSAKQEALEVREVAPEGKPKNTLRLDIPASTVAKAVLTLLAIVASAWLLFALRDKLIILLLAMFIAIVIDTNVRFLERMGLPRPIAVLLLYLVFLSIAIFLVASLIPIVALQLQDMARFVNRSADTFLLDPQVHMPFFSESMNERLTIVLQDIMEQMGVKDRASALFQFGQNLSTVAQSSIGFAVQVAGSVFNFIVTLILILVLCFFIQLEREKISDFVRSVLPRDYRAYYDAKSDAIYLKMSQWFHGQLILCLSIGLLVFLALQILGMPYAQTLALLAGFTEFIPYAGPLIAAFPAVLIALSQEGFVWAVVVAVVYYVIQVCENNLLVPLIMKHAVGLSPISIIFGMLVGISFPETVHPVVGIILAVPATAILTIFIRDFYVFRRRK